MTKITKIEDKTFNGEVTGHIITLSDGTNGYLNDKTSDPVVVGEDVDCTLEIKRNKKGGNYNLLTLKKAGSPPLAPPPTPPQRPTINVGSGKSKEEVKAEASTQIMLKLLDAVYSGQIDSAKVAPELKEWDILLWAEIDECYSK